jgi:hypothetical protein
MLPQWVHLQGFSGSWRMPICGRDIQARSDQTVKGKEKCTLAQALRLCTGSTAHRRSRGTALPFHDHGTRRGWGVSVTPRPIFTPRKDPVPIVLEAGWAPGPVWTSAENLAPPPGFNPRTIQPIASCYTDYATQAKWPVSGSTEMNESEV